MTFYLLVNYVDIYRILGLTFIQLLHSLDNQIQRGQVPESFLFECFLPILSWNVGDNEKYFKEEMGMEEIREISLQTFILELLFHTMPVSDIQFSLKDMPLLK